MCALEKDDSGMLAWEPWLWGSGDTSFILMWDCFLEGSPHVPSFCLTVSYWLYQTVVVSDSTSLNLGLRTAFRWLCRSSVRSASALHCRTVTPTVERITIISTIFFKKFTFCFVSVWNFQTANSLGLAMVLTSWALSVVLTKPWLMQQLGFCYFRNMTLN